MFGERLSALRTNKDLSQQELANRLGIAKSTLSMYETNKRQPDFDTLEKIADFFEVSSDYLLGRSNEKTLSKQENELLSDLKNIPIEDILKKYPLSYRGRELSDQDKISMLGFIKALQDIRDENS